MTLQRTQALCSSAVQIPSSGSESDPAVPPDPQSGGAGVFPPSLLEPDAGVVLPVDGEPTAIEMMSLTEAGSTDQLVEHESEGSSPEEPADSQRQSTEQAHAMAKQSLVGLGWMLFSAFCFSFMSLGVNFAGANEHIPAFELVVVRSILTWLGASARLSASLQWLTGHGRHRDMAAGHRELACGQV